MLESMSAPDVTRERIVGLPKVELHLHLEGAIPLDSLLELIHGCGDRSVTDLEALERRFVFRDFEQFRDTWIWKNQFLRRPDDFEFIAYEVLRSLARQGIVYAEPSVSAGEHTNRGLDPVEVVRAVLRGAARAERDFGIRTGLLVDLVRDFGPERGLEWLRSLEPLRDEGLVGIGLGGSEHRVPAEQYVAVFHLARAMGFRLTAHAGETMGPQSVRAALDRLGAERIGHGVRAVEDPALVDELARRRVPLEVCPISNLRTAVVSRLAEHPIRQLVAAGVPVSVNSDDPTMFQTSLVEEYLALHRELGFDMRELVALAAEGIRSSFASVEERQEMLAALHRFGFSDQGLSG
jgi:adenosine deaminase